MHISIAYLLNALLSVQMLDTSSIFFFNIRLLTLYVQERRRDPFVSVASALTIVIYRCTTVQRGRTAAQTLGRHFQPQPILAYFGDHSGPLLVRLAGAETHGSVGSQPLLHQRFIPLARQTHLPLGQAPDQAFRLVNCCIYASSLPSCILACLLTDGYSFQNMI